MSTYETERPTTAPSDATAAAHGGDGKVRVALVGLGKMGISHCSLLNAHPHTDLTVCDSSGYITGVLGKYTGLETHGDFASMLEKVELDAVVVATPTPSHVPLADAALERGLDVFCEKPLTLDSAEATRLAGKARAKGRVTQVGYHNRYIAMFREVKRLLDSGAIGRVTHVLGEAYGPVVLKPSGGTWRHRRSEGGGCLHDYAAHVVDLVTWYLGEPLGVGGTAFNSVHSHDIEDEVYSTMYYPEGCTAQVSVNWSDESQRKMSTKISIWGTAGRITVSRQDCHVYLRDEKLAPPGYEKGWNVRYTTDDVDDVWFYLRGEEYSAQVDDFIRRVRAREIDGVNTFDSAAVTDRVLGLMAQDAARGVPTASHQPATSDRPVRRRRRSRGYLQQLARRVARRA